MQCRLSAQVCLWCAQYSAALGVLSRARQPMCYVERSTVVHVDVQFVYVYDLGVQAGALWPQVPVDRAGLVWAGLDGHQRHRVCFLADQGGAAVHPHRH